jgi:ribosomal protein S18 acetylase RimI-like enzyme
METGKIKLRRATTKDVDSILEVEKTSLGIKTYSGLSGEGEIIKEIENSFFYLIEKDGKIVGDTSYEMKSKDHAYISGLIVAPQFQGQGIARQAMNEILEKLKDVKVIDLLTHPENEKAIGLYESLGFKKTGEKKENYFGDGEPRIEMVFKR